MTTGLTMLQGLVNDAVQNLAVARDAYAAIQTRHAEACAQKNHREVEFLIRRLEAARNAVEYRTRELKTLDENLATALRVEGVRS